MDAFLIIFFEKQKWNTHTTQTQTGYREFIITQVHTYVHLYIHTHTRKRKHKGKTGSYKRGRSMYWNMYVCLEASISVREEGGRCVYV